MKLACLVLLLALPACRAADYDPSCSCLAGKPTVRFTRYYYLASEVEPFVAHCATLKCDAKLGQ